VARQDNMTPRFRTPSCTVAAGRLRPLALISGFLLSVILALAAPVPFDIPAQPAPAAIQLFIKQSGASVLYSADQLSKVRTTEVKGEFEPLAALQQLLAGTGFTVREQGPTSFVIEPISTKSGSVEGSVQSESGKPVASARVSLTGTRQMTVTDKRGRFTFEDVPAGSQALIITAEGMQNTKVTDVTVKAGHRLTLSAIDVPVKPEGALQLEDFVVSAKKNEDVVELDPYSVSGQRAQPFANGNMDISRTINDAQPYYVFEAKTIDTSGATNVEDFLKQRLTMNTVANTNGQMAGVDGTSGNTSSINLRGLGIDKTLILVNGRRMPGVSLFDTTLPAAQPDLNGIPVNAIDRIEVLPSSASGIYGGSAIGDVVNVVLKKDYAGGEIRAS